MGYKNKWQKLSTKQLYNNPWIEVHEDQVINPSGGNGIYGRVMFKNTAIGIIPLDADDNTWLVGQWRYTLNEYSWEIPMGGGPKNEDTLASAKRELKEETGLLASKWQNLGKVHTSNSVTNETGYIYLAQDLEQSTTEFDETEDIQIKKMPFAEAVEWVMNGKITDAISICGILKLNALMRQQKAT